jgi:hypothetical protein
MTDGENKLRELVLLRGARNNMLSADSEEELLEIAVTQLNLTLQRAHGIIIATAESAGYEVQSEIDRVTEAMVAALSASSRVISHADFETVASYHAGKMNVSLLAARRRIKDIVERLKINPERRGLLWSARWFRTIR